MLPWLGLLGFAAADAAEPTAVQAWVTLPHGTEASALFGPDVGFAEGREAADEGERVRVVAYPDALDRLEDGGLQVVRLSYGTQDRVGYRLPDEVDLDDYLNGRSGRTTLGRSVEGRAIEALWYGQPPRYGARSVRLAGAHHGDEASSYEVALDAAAWLADADGVDPDVTALLDETTVWVVPWVNPDGVQANTRQNARSVDLNRNYGFEWSSQAFQAGPFPFSEPETRAFRDHGLFALPHTSLSLHSGATNIGYVWNYTYDATPEEGLLDELGELYADGADTRGFYVTNGADWYPTRGDTNDWSYGSYGGMDFTVELTQNKTPVGTDIPSFLSDHRDAVHNIVLAPPGLTGSVSTTNADPLWAEMTLLSNGVVVSAPFFSNPHSGHFARHIDGADTLRITSPGYRSQEQPLLFDRPTQLALTPEGLVQGDVRPFHATPGSSVSLGAMLGPVVSLKAPGRSAVVTVANDTLTVPDDLPPGLYSVVGPDGSTLRDALFVDAVAGATIDGASVAGTVLTVSGTDLGRGVRVQARAPSTDHWRWLDPLDTDTTSASFTLPPQLVSAPDLDIAVVASGTHLGISLSNLRDPDDTGTVRDSGPITIDRVPNACGCSTTTVGGLWLLAFLLIPLYRRRTL